jgi:hypothetical protein
MYNGDDTATYLNRGYRVVSIEAHPTWAEDGRRRFADAIRDGRLTILNVAIGPEEGVAPLFVNEEYPDRTTLSRAIPTAGAQPYGEATDGAWRTLGEVA